jgi:hypothetical protein
MLCHTNTENYLPKEREEIVKYRRSHGYPLHAPPHPFRGAGAYLISAANFEHQARMSSPNRRTGFEAYLKNKRSFSKNGLPKRFGGRKSSSLR